MTSTCDVVITGLGMVSPIGIDNDAYWNALLSRQSGVRVREHFESVENAFRIAADVADFEPKKYVRPRKSLKVMCRPIQFGFAAATQAVEQAGISGHVDPDRFSTVFGTEAFYADPHEVALVFRKCIVNRCYDHNRWGEYAMREIEPLWMLKYLPNMVASHLSIACDARGPSNTICQAEASSLLALIEAVDLIQRGAADAAIAGGTGAQMSTTGLIYRGLDRLSRRIHEPQRASRPFDRDRDGMVVGEGAAAFVLERADLAAARGARPLARILGFDRSFVKAGELNRAVAESLCNTLQHADVTVNDLGHCNAHGLSTRDDDSGEAQGIAAALKDTPVIAPKSSFGNLGPGTGAVELVASINACQTRRLPPILNLDHQDPDCPINAVTSDTVLAASQCGVTLNFTEAGQLASLLIAAA